MEAKNWQIDKNPHISRKEGEKTATIEAFAQIYQKEAIWKALPRLRCWYVYQITAYTGAQGL